jgi:uncharacterized protein (DUF1015 family)
MAKVFPFRALRYNPNKVPVVDVVTQPYDKISRAMQDRYYGASPYNLVRVILGKPEPGDNEKTNVYTRAAENRFASRGIRPARSMNAAASSPPGNWKPTTKRSSSVTSRR